MNTETTSLSETTPPPALMSADSLDYYRRNWQAEKKRYDVCIGILERLGARLTERVSFSPSVYITISVHSREDLSVLMELAPKWNKTPSETGIVYYASVDGEEIQINALDAALPGTCKLVEEEYEVPAVEAKPARKATRMVLKCANVEGAQ